MTTSIARPAEPSGGHITRIIDDAMNDRRWRWAARVVVVTPILVAVVRALLDGWMPVGDDALLAIRAYDVGTSHHPWLGSWTSASLAVGTDVNNPGPLYFDLLAPFMWTIGRAFSIAAATAIGVGTLNTLAAFGVMGLGNRLGGWRVERWMMLIVAMLCWSMGSELLFDIWQPHALLLPFCVLLTLTTALLAGDWRLMPWWLFVSSLIVQTHVAYVYVAGALGVAVVVAAVRFLVQRESGLHALLRHPTVRWSSIVVALCWVQPVWEQLFGSGRGNLARLVSAAGGGDVTIGAGQGVRIVAAVTAVPPMWTRFGFADSVLSTPLVDTGDGASVMIPGLPSRVEAVIGLLVLVAALVALLIWAVRARRVVERSALVVSAIALVVALVGVSTQTVTLTGFGNHQVRWLFSMAVFVHVVLIWVGCEWWADRRPAIRRVIDVAVPVVVVVATVANLPHEAHPLGPTADRDAAATLESTFADLSELDPNGTVLYDTTNVRVFEPYSSAVMMRLRELGIDFNVADEIAVRQFGEARREDGDEIGTMRQYERADALLYDGDGCVVSLRSGVGDGGVDVVVAAATDDLVGAAIVSEGLASDVADLVVAATSGDRDAAFRLVTSDLLRVLIDEDRVEPTPALEAAIARRDAIVAWVNTTLAVVVEPASVCDR